MVKEILGVGRSLSGSLLMYDALNASFETLAVTKRAGCPTCGASARTRAVSEGGVSVILRSDDYESVHYGLALAAAALAVNKPAVLFFTMGASAPCKALRQRCATGRAMPPTTRAASATSRRCCGYRRAGARLIVCEMGLQRSLDIDRAGLRADVPFTVAGIDTLLEETKPGMHLVSL